jgi:hypothetical protein
MWQRLKKIAIFILTAVRTSNPTVAKIVFKSAVVNGISYEKDSNASVDRRNYL